MASHSGPTVDHRERTATMIDVRGVVRRFGAVQALDPVDLTVRRGEFVSIVGPSGCGNSTLLEPEARGVGRAERHARARELVEVVGLAGFEDARPPQLSGGMRQRVAIARCLSMHPDLILADEPFGALDEQTRLLMAAELLRVVERLTCSVLFVTHSLQEAVLLSDRVVVMSARPGRILEVLPVTLDRPRSTEVLTTPEATAAIERLWSLLRHEADTAMQAVR